MPCRSPELPDNVCGWYFLYRTVLSSTLIPSNWGIPHHAAVPLEMRLLTQADLTPVAAANLWSTVKSEASDLGADIVSPAVNFCGGDCNEEVGQGYSSSVCWPLPPRRLCAQKAVHLGRNSNIACFAFCVYTCFR